MRSGCRLTDCVTGHVNNVTYNRWAESSRVNWALNLAAADAEHREEWKGLIVPKGIGMILRSIKTDYKFVSPDSQGNPSLLLVNGSAGNSHARIT